MSQDVVTLLPDAYLVLMIFSMSDVGLTEKEFIRQAEEVDITEPMKVFAELQDLGLVRVQDMSKERCENRLKATNKAFTTVIKCA